MAVDSAINPDCRCCGAREFEFLDADADTARMLCGRNAVQVRPLRDSYADIDLEGLAGKLAGRGTFTVGNGALRGTFDDERTVSGQAVELVVFADGRAIIGGDTDPAWAQGIYNRFIGS